MLSAATFDLFVTFLGTFLEIVDHVTLPCHPGSDEVF